MTELKREWNERAARDHVCASIGCVEDRSKLETLFQFPTWMDCIKGKIVLDVGCGYGRLLVPLATEASLVVGLDVSRVMIEFAKQYSRMVSSRVEFVLGSAEKLPFRAGSFDFSVCILTLQHLPKSTANLSIREMLRTVRDMGTAYFQFPNAVCWEGLIAALERFVWVRLLRRRLSISYIRFYTLHELRTIFGKLGATTIQGYDFFVVPFFIPMRGFRVNISIFKSYIFLKVAKSLERVANKHSVLGNLGMHFLVKVRKQVAD